jgi:hypothetical protein
MKPLALPWAMLVAAAALFYPIFVLAASGSPRFPSRAECARPATSRAKIDAVFGRFDTTTSAERRLHQVLGAGFKGSVIELDDCGRLAVVVHGVPTLEVGEELRAEARSVGLDLALERARD